GPARRRWCSCARGPHAACPKDMAASRAGSIWASTSSPPLRRASDSPATWHTTSVRLHCDRKTFRAFSWPKGGTVRLDRVVNPLYRGGEARAGQGALDLSLLLAE